MSSPRFVPTTEPAAIIPAPRPSYYSAHGHIADAIREIEEWEPAVHMKHAPTGRALALQRAIAHLRTALRLTANEAPNE